MQKFQEKPQPPKVVEAVQFTGDAKADWIHNRGLRIVRTDRVYLVAIDGPRKDVIEAGDWAVFDDVGHMYGMKDADFKARYEPAKEDVKATLAALK